MFTMIIGGSASGKSRYAEEWTAAQKGHRIYIATMEPFGEEAQKRIARHRAQRALLHFETIECFTGLGRLSPAANANILLEDLGNLMANERFRADGGGREAVLEGVEYLLSRSRNLTVVTNEVFSGGMDYDPDTLAYLRDLALVNRTLALRADVVVEMVCGIPCRLKDTLGEGSRS